MGEIDNYTEKEVYKWINLQLLITFLKKYIHIKEIITPHSFSNRLPHSKQHVQIRV